MAMYPRNIKAAQFRIKFREQFNLKMLYLRMHEWLVQEAWATRKDDDFPEIFCGQNESALGGTETWFYWRMHKFSGAGSPGTNNYYRWSMNINGHVILLREVEAIKDGKKFKTNWGEVEIIIDAKVETDYNKTWRKHKILKHFEDLFRSRIFKKELEKSRDELYREAYRFQDAIKDYLEIRRHSAESESQGPFFPKRGIGE
ncbi:hypothetical protein KY313_01590 [Candidatus Woesearchaeota archaeon]|nr:hypothetical protein [Candidatus Woesearchaeota archaeon]